MRMQDVITESANVTEGCLEMELLLVKVCNHDFSLHTCIFFPKLNLLQHILTSSRVVHLYGLW